MTGESASAPPPSKLSQQGLMFIASFEGWVPHCYDDPTGNCTIGYGHLVHLGPTTAADRRKWGTISHDAGIELLAADAAQAVRCVLANVRPAIERQTRFDALVDFAFNLGCGPLRSGSGLHDCLNTPSRKGVTQHLAQYVNSGGVRLPGLVRRRHDEIVLWDEGTYPLSKYALP